MFHLFFRTPPFGSGFTIACGQAAAIDWFRDFRFGKSDLANLAVVTGQDGRRQFDPAFLDYLGKVRATCGPGLDTSRFTRVFRKGADPGIDSYSSFFANGCLKATGPGRCP